ncbi:MAG: N-acetyltransferase [Verrucomicrobiaceae bacterium]|nr:MAG: N-acetyltransferase [Verrucomicrobiaceae bacterium]
MSDSTGPLPVILAAEESSLTRLLDAAFGPSTCESALIRAVISRGDGHHAWILEEDGVPVAFILYTVATRGAEAVGYHLAPVAVHPDFQGRGSGSELIRRTLAMEPLSSSAVFVLGDPAFYERFGFSRVSSALCPYDEENRHFRALRWDDSGEPFVIGYAASFGGL